MNRFAVAFLSSTLLLAGFHVYAAEIEYGKFHNILVGSDACQARCFFQDDDGFIWIGTNKGLCRYDGYSVHQHYGNGSPENIQIHCMAALGGDMILLGTESGLMLYDLRRGRYSEPEWTPTCIVRSMYVDGDTLWLGTTHGLFSLDINGDVLGITEKTGGREPMIDGVDVYSIVRLRDRIFAGSATGMWCKPNNEEGFRTVDTGNASRFIVALYPDESENVLWFGTGKLYRYHVYSERIEAVADSVSVKTLTMDSDGRLLVGTDYGLFSLNPKDGKKEWYSHKLNQSNSLSNNVVQSVFRDRDGNIWIGTDYGISLARRNKSYNHYSIGEFTEGALGNQFFVMKADGRSNLWMGGNNGLIMKPLSGEGKTLWYRMSGATSDLVILHNRIRDVYLDDSDGLWVSSDGGLELYDYDRGVFEAHYVLDTLSGTFMRWAYTILQDRRGDFWFSTYNLGVFQVDAGALSSSPVAFARRFSSSDGLSSNYINSMAYNGTSDAVFVLMNRGGVERIECAGGKTSNLGILEHTGGQFPSVLMSDNDEHIWIGYGDGLLRYNSLDGTIVKYPFGNGRSLSLTCMTKVGDNIWVCTDDGLRVVFPDGRPSERYNLDDRVYYSICYEPKYGVVYLGTADGVSTVIPENLLSDKSGQWKMALSRIRVGGREYVGEDGLASRYVGNMVLSYDENDITVELADLSYSEARMHAVSYFLEPKGVKQSLSGSSNVISLNGLDSGTYSLYVSMGEEAASWSGENLRPLLSFRIKPHPLRSPLAVTVYAVLALLVLLATVRNIRLNNRLRLERMERETTLRRAEEKMQFYSDISHEFKTPLSMILAPVSKMLTEKRPEKDVKDLRLIHDYALKMNQLLHRAIEFDKDGEYNDVELVRSEVELVGFAKTVFSVFRDNAKGSGCQFIFTSSVEELYCMLDVVKLESILNNLISNSCKYTGAGDSIIVSIDIAADSDNVEIKVSDTGSGIAPEDLPYIFHRFYKSPSGSVGKEGTGIGLALVKSYVSQHGGNITASSEPGRGSTFLVSLPIVWPDSGSGQVLPAETDERKGLPLIVIVEDNEAIARFLRELFHDDYRCMVAFNGRTGLKLCTELHPDLLIADIMMPEMDGISMCRHLRENPATASIPIMVLSALEDKKYRMFSAENGIDAYITKPFDANYVRTIASNLIEKKRELEKRIRIEFMTEPKSIEAVSADEKLLSAMVEVIEEHISDPDFNVTAFCELLDISSKQLYRKCKQLLRQKPVEYIRSVRLKKAALLLRQHNFNVSEVMYMVGFSSHSYFTKCFVAEFGVTPQQYRAEHSEK